MIKVAITGNIGSGKSIAENYLLSLGFKVCDTDILSHEILENSKEISDIFQSFDIYTDNKIDRQKIGKIVFQDKEKLNALEKIIHPAVKNELLHFFEQNTQEKAVFVSVPQLFEADFTNMFDKIILICTDEKIRLKRIMQRNNFTEKEALIRIKAQLPDTDKIPKSDYVIRNDGSINDFTQKIKETVISICQITS